MQIKGKFPGNVVDMFQEAIKRNREGKCTTALLITTKQDSVSFEHLITNENNCMKHL